MNDKLIPEHHEVAKILADNFTPEQYDDSDFEWCAYQLVQAGYHKQTEGEWKSELVKRCDWKGKERQYYQPNSCSLCHKAVLTRTPFCPNCGAKMKEGANNAQG